MIFKFAHNNINVADLDKAVAFYTDALGLKEMSRKESGDGSFILVFMGDGVTDWRLELTWLRDHPQSYDLGENEIHFCLTVDDYKAALDKHRAMGCVCFENKNMGVYFIEDPDGYWVEIVPADR